jgi:hypothetical protein
MALPRENTLDSPELAGAAGNVATQCTPLTKSRYVHGLDEGDTFYLFNLFTEAVLSFDLVAMTPGSPRTAVPPH